MDSTLVLQFGENLAFLVLAAFLFGLIVQQYLGRHRRLSVFASGVLFGAMAIVSMLFPLEPLDGVIFDGRGVVVALAGPFGGGFGGLIAGAIAASYRMSLGGPGALAGVLGIAASAVFGVVYWKIRGVGPRHYNLYDFLAIGVLLPAVSLPALFVLPTDVAVEILGRVLVPLVIYEIIAVLVMGLFLRQELQRNIAVKDLQSSEQRFRDFTEIASDYYWETDENGRFTYFSEQFEDVSDYPRNIAIGQTRAELWSALGSSLYTPNAPDQDIFRLVEDRRPFRRVRANMPQPQREDRVIEISGRPVFDQDGTFKGYRGVGLDVTQEEQAIRAEKTARKRAEEAQRTADLANRAKTDFLARMSHELRSPLNAVLGFANVLAREPEGSLGAPIYRDYVENIRLAGDHLQALIGDILDLVKVEAGHLALEAVPFSPRQFGEHIQALMAESAKERNNRLRLDLDETLPACVIGDQTRLRQVIVNFLSNAVKFTSDGEIVLAIKTMEQHDGNVCLEISVSDTGVGMEQENQEAVFDAFTQADVSVTRKFGGTGLGLAVSKRLVENMEGDIGVESKRGEGSRFWCRVTLPYDDSIEVEAVAGQLRDRELLPMRLLVVDDIEVNRQLAKALLSSDGHQVIEASEGADALAIMHSEEGYDIDAVLMDIHMPHMNGMDAARMIRETFDDRRANVPIIALTADVMQENIRLYDEVGMNGFVGKPLKLPELHQVLAKHLPHKLSTGGADHDEQQDVQPVKGIEVKKRGSGAVIDPMRLSMVFQLYPGEGKEVVLDSLRSQCNQFIDAAMDAHATGDKEAVRLQIHSLKGIASNIGFNDLAGLCRSLEQQLKQIGPGGDIDLRGLEPTLDEAVREAASQPIENSPLDN